MAYTYILMASPTQEQEYVHMCVCVSFQRLEVAKLLQHLLLTGCVRPPCVTYIRTHVGMYIVENVLHKPISHQVTTETIHQYILP